MFLSDILVVNIHEARARPTWTGVRLGAIIGYNRQKPLALPGTNPVVGGQCGDREAGAGLGSKSIWRWQRVYVYFLQEARLT